MPLFVFFLFARHLPASLSSGIIRIYSFLGEVENISGPAPVSDMRTVNWRASVSCHFASTPARPFNAPLRIPLAVLDPVYASVWPPLFSRVLPRHVAARGANRRGPRGEPPRPGGFWPIFSLLYKDNCPFFFLFSHSPTFAHSAPRLCAFAALHPPSFARAPSPGGAARVPSPGGAARVPSPSGATRAPSPVDAVASAA